MAEGSSSGDTLYGLSKTSTPREILLSKDAAIIADDVNFLFEYAQSVSLNTMLNPKDIQKFDAEIFKQMEIALEQGKALSLGIEASSFRYKPNRS